MILWKMVSRVTILSVDGFLDLCLRVGTPDFSMGPVIFRPQSRTSPLWWLRNSPAASKTTFTSGRQNILLPLHADYHRFPFRSRKQQGLGQRRGNCVSSLCRRGHHVSRCVANCSSDASTPADPEPFTTPDHVWIHRQFKPPLTLRRYWQMHWGSWRLVLDEVSCDMLPSVSCHRLPSWSSCIPGHQSG